MSGRKKEFIQRADRQVPQVADWATESNLPMLPRIVSGLAENTNSIFCDGPGARYSEWMSGSAMAGTIAERHRCELVIPRHWYLRAPQKRASGDVCFLLTNDLHGRRLHGDLPDTGL